MLLVSLTLVANGFGLWFTYMVRYPKSWEARIDGWHERIRPLGLSFDWMRRMEKGITLKILVVVTTILIVSCAAVLLRHPSAWSDFLRDYNRPLP